MSVILVEGDYVITIRKRSCGKVMFLEVFVGVKCAMKGGSVKGVPWKPRGGGEFREETPSSVGQQAGGTHPTGIILVFTMFLSQVCNYVLRVYFVKKEKLINEKFYIPEVAIAVIVCSMFNTDDVKI